MSSNRMESINLGRSESGGAAAGLPPSLTHAVLSTSSWCFRTRPPPRAPITAGPTRPPTRPSVTHPACPCLGLLVLSWQQQPGGGGSDFASPAPPPVGSPFPNLPVPMATDSPNICPHLEQTEGGAPSTTSAVAPPSESSLSTAGCVSATPPAPGSPAPLWGPENTCVKQQLPPS